VTNNVHPFPVKSATNPLFAASASMTSKDIADLVGSRHDKVMQSIERLATRDAIRFPPLVYSEEINNLGLKRKVKHYVFSGEQGKRDSIVVVAQLSPEFTARLVDRWLELEQQAALNAFNIPDTLHGALQLAADLAKEKAEAESALALAAPKVAFHDAVTEAINCQTVQEVAKVLGVGPNRMFQFLREEKMLMHNNLPYQQHLDAGHFRVIEKCFRDEHGERNTYTRTLVTGKGLAYIQKRQHSSRLPMLATA